MNDMNKNELKEKVVDYASKVFFYCVKRCNNRMDAEDLSQTILLEIIQNIDKGAHIDNLDYYIWGVCKNQYNMYLRKTIKDRNNIEYKEDIDSADDSKTALNKMLEDEKIRRMNQAIKLLSKDYAEILYAYYVEDKTLKFIAEELNIPLGTVKKRLFTIRQKLKEYLDMEKLNGKKAYIPKDFQVSMMGNEGKFNPCREVPTMIHKNLLFHSYNNPCTIEDYSLELGIARPYIEEIVNRLVEVTLLKKEGDKYITNFAFINKNTMNEIETIKKKYSQNIGKGLIDFTTNYIDKYKGYLHLSNIEKNKLMWSLLLYSMFFLECRCYHQYHHTKRPGDGRWDFSMVEGDDIDRISVHGFDCVSCYGYIFSSSDCNDVIFEEKALNGDENFGSIYNAYNELNSNEEDVMNNKILKRFIDEALEKGFIDIVDNKVQFNVPIIEERDLFKINSVLLSEKYESLRNSYIEMGKEIKELLKSYIPVYLENQLDYLVSNFAIVKGLVIDEFYNKKMLCKENDKMYFTYNGIIILRK